MKATLPTQPVSNARQLYKKEVINHYHAIGLIDGEIVPLVDCRLYMSRSGDGASPVYCALWLLYGENGYSSGRGTASGYGYHKRSSAVGQAIRSAGIKLDENIDGVGDDAVKDALTAIAEACGATQVLVVG